MLVPVWRRSWRDAALVGVWMALNPVVFGKPAHERAWATRAVLGEEHWVAERPMDTAMAVDVAATVAGLVAMVAAGQRRAMPAAAATAFEMGLLMAYWQLMARYYDRNECVLEAGVMTPGTSEVSSCQPCSTFGGTATRHR
jgi:pyrroline-5-carboxylate reductase